MFLSDVFVRPFSFLSRISWFPSVRHFSVLNFSVSTFLFFFAPLRDRAVHHLTNFHFAVFNLKSPLILERTGGGSPLQRPVILERTGRLTPGRSPETLFDLFDPFH